MADEDAKQQDDAKRAEDAKRKEEALLRAEKRLLEEAAAFRRKEDAEQRQLKYGCIGCLTFLVIAMLAAFLLS